MLKFLLYVVVLPLVIFAFDSVNISGIFKKNKYYQSRVFYILVIFGLSYLVCNFLYDFIYIVK